MRCAHSIFIGVLLCAIFVACKTLPGLLPTSEQLLKSGCASEWIDKDSLAKGRVLAVTECVGCHRFYFPKEYTSEQWDRIIRKKAKRLSLSKEQMADINLYFQAASSKREER